MIEINEFEIPVTVINNFVTACSYFCFVPVFHSTFPSIEFLSVKDGVH